MLEAISDAVRIRSLYGRYQTMGYVEFSRLGESLALKAFNSTSHEYNLRMGLYNELEELNDGDVVWDGGCGFALPISTLQRGGQRRLRFLGIDYIADLLFNGGLATTRPSVPIIQGLLEDLNGGVRRKAESIDMSPPRMIIMSNSLYHAQQFNTLDLVLKSAYRVLRADGVVLIYSENGIASLDDTPALYREIGESNQSHNIGFVIDIRRGDGTYCDHYMRLTK